MPALERRLMLSVNPLVRLYNSELETVLVNLLHAAGGCDYIRPDYADILLVMFDMVNS